MHEVRIYPLWYSRFHYGRSMIAIETLANTCAQDIFYINVVFPVHGSLRFVNVKIIMPTRHVHILHAVPQLTGSSALAIFGGYLGIWLGLSVHDITANVRAFIGLTIDYFKDPSLVLLLWNSNANPQNISV
ncbi:hypothetical protein BIW11_03941 [Tropilaelaps mercedesae]|uniref:Uncharacterized protein n=1 Tax=Tropilaelaps mercedesae TaxID=418985 RepID=A0A1V9XE23_9ACAR|nr:hypothetical protein BIW11_03941 [Tropilaelaps mercedesae]